MTSIYQRALGSDFAPPPPARSSGGSASTAPTAIASIGRGVMDEVWKGRPYTLPFLYVGTWRRIMFPETGRDIPFTIENYAFVDDFGRETVSWVRTFESTRTRRFDAYMVYSEARGRIVDYLGSHEHLAVDIDLTVDERGRAAAPVGRCSASTRARSPSTSRWLFSGVADVREWYDERDRPLPDRRRRAEPPLGPPVRVPRQLRRRVAHGGPGHGAGRDPADAPGAARLTEGPAGDVRRDRRRDGRGLVVVPATDQRGRRGGGAGPRADGRSPTRPAPPR